MQDDTTRPTLVSPTADTTDVAQVNSLTGMITRAAAALARATTSAEVLDVIQHTTVAYDAARTTARLVKARDAHAEIIAACHKAQADALEIEAAAQCRLADEYDAAQARGEIATHSAGNPQIIQNTNDLPLTAAEVGLSNKIVHEARKVRDAERENPGIVRRTLGEQLSRGEAPTRADIKRAIAPKRTVAAVPLNTFAPTEPAADDDEATNCRDNKWCRFCVSRDAAMICASETDGSGGPHEDDDDFRTPYICEECVSRCVEIIQRRRGER
jgi:hypothetical protein